MPQQKLKNVQLIIISFNEIKLTTLQFLFDQSCVCVCVCGKTARLSSDANVYLYLLSALCVCYVQLYDYDNHELTLLFNI